jgi:lysozyme family protein
MAKVPTYTEALKAEYKSLFDSIVIRPGKQTTVETIVNKIKANQARYESVAKKLGCPWFFVGVIHNMEASLNFKKHLHNGDPLTARTVHFPPNHPVKGSPPFTWEESAEDALRLKSIDKWTDWTIEGMLFKLEGYNGWGYRMYHPHVLSPYLWSYSNHYSQGKYVSDGTWSDTAISQQCGSAVLLRRFLEIGLSDQNKGGVDVISPIKLKAPMVSYSMTKFSQEAVALQNALNAFSGIYVKPDGIPGKRTSDALKYVTGSYLKGDPRNK